MEARVSELWWVSVGGNECEPARIVANEGGIKTIYTIGCDSGTLVSEGSIVLVQQIDDAPDTPAEAEAERIAWDKRRAADERRGISHGYRRF
jgi:hypothetical protein